MSTTKMASPGFQPELHQTQTHPSIQDLQHSLASLSTNQTELLKTQNSILEQFHKLKPSLHLNFPVFHGGKDNPLDWVSLADRHFKFLATPEADKVEVASLHLQGTATPWMDWYESKHGLGGSWDHFVKVFLSSFGPPSLGYLDYNGSWAGSSRRDLWRSMVGLCCFLWFRVYVAGKFELRGVSKGL